MINTFYTARYIELLKKDQNLRSSSTSLYKEEKI